MTNRICGDCTKCCEGPLIGNAHGKTFYPGKPCHYLGCNGCSIYPNRPKDPCQDYRCVWLDNKELPEWMQPHMSGVIISRIPYKNTFYWAINEAGHKMDAAVLSWLIVYALNNKINIRYQIDGGWTKIGFNEEFLKDMSL